MLKPEPMVMHEQNHEETKHEVSKSKKYLQPSSGCYNFALIPVFVGIRVDGSQIARKTPREKI